MNAKGYRINEHTLKGILSRLEAKMDYRASGGLVVKLQETGEQVHIGFRWVDDEQVCYISSSKDGLHVKE